MRLLVGPKLLVARRCEARRHALRSPFFNRTDWNLNLQPPYYDGDYVVALFFVAAVTLASLQKKAMPGAQGTCQCVRPHDVPACIDPESAR